MVDALLGAVGSPLDVATLVYLLVEVRWGVLPRVRSTAAAATALARETDGVDGDRTAVETDADRREVEALRTGGSTDG